MTQILWLVRDDSDGTERIVVSLLLLFMQKNISCQKNKNNCAGSMAAQDPNDAEYDEAPGLTRVGLKRIPVQVSNPSPSAPAAETRNGTMERYLVDLGEPADGAKIVVAVAQSSTVGTLRATTEVRAQKRVDAIGGLRLKELRTSGGFTLDDEDIASDVIERSETLTVEWAANEDEDAAPLSNVQADPQRLAAAKEVAEDQSYSPSRPYRMIAVNVTDEEYEETLDDDDPEGTYSWGGDDDVPIALATLVTSSPDQAASSRRRVHIDDPPMAPPRHAAPPPPSLSPLSAVGRLLSTAFEGSSNEFATSSSAAGHQQHQQRPPPPQPQHTPSQPPQLPLATSRRRDGAANCADDEHDAGRSAAGQTVPTAGPSRGATGTAASSPRREPPLGDGGSSAPFVRSDHPGAHRPRPERDARADRHGRASAGLADEPAAASSSSAAAIASATVTIDAVGAAQRKADAAATSEVRPPPTPLPEKKRREDASAHRPPTAPFVWQWQWL